MRWNAWAVLAAAVLSLGLVSCDDGDETPTPAVSPTGIAQEQTPLPTLPPGTAEPSETAEAGEPAAIELAADPPSLVCDGVQPSKVTARVLDGDGVPVKDGTPVRFSVVALGTADPIDATTTDGVAETSVVALGSQVGVVVNVTAGEIQQGIRIDCQ